MRQEAVVLSYLEWVRLIRAGAIRLDERRIVRWRPDRVDPAEVVAEFMLSAPDLGTSATSFVLALLEPNVLDRMRENGLNLGPRLTLETVRSFHSFGAAALAIQRHDAEAAGVTIGLTPLADGWASWAAAVEAAERRVQGEALLALLDVPPCDRFNQAAIRLADRERCIAAEDISRARDSMFYGWACVLNAQKVSTGVAPILPKDVKDEVDALRKEFDVDQPFLTRAPRLLEFVATLGTEDDRPADLLAMASLKQHERYAIKREGSALDLPSLFDDIRVLESLDASAAGLLVQALGARLPGELIRALAVGGVTRAVAPAEMPIPAGEDAPSASDPTSSGGANPGPSPSLLPRLAEVTPPKRTLVLETTSKGSIGSSVATEIGMTAEDLGATHGEATAVQGQDVEALRSLTEHQEVSLAPDQPGLDFELSPMKLQDVDPTCGSEDTHKIGSTSRSKPKSAAKPTKPRKSRKKDPTNS